MPDKQLFLLNYSECHNCTVIAWEIINFFKIQGGQLVWSAVTGRLLIDKHIRFLLTHDLKPTKSLIVDETL